MSVARSNRSRLRTKLKTKCAAETGREGGCRLQILQEQSAEVLQSVIGPKVCFYSWWQVKHCAVSHQPSLSAL